MVPVRIVPLVYRAILHQSIQLMSDETDIRLFFDICGHESNYGIQI